LYGLAYQGEAGVRHVLSLLQQEIDTALALLGLSTIDELDASVLAPAVNPAAGEHESLLARKETAGRAVGR
jgi:isopentenyl diphosphate isomerase/L-lactate dehydrogenase-like FMN-dependent dehydrogenase